MNKATRVKSKIKKDDQVVVIAGKDKGKQGVVRQVLPNSRYVVTGINMVKKHTKPNPQLGKTGGIVEKEASIHASNIAIFNTATNKPDRVGYKIEDGKKVRIYKSTSEVI